MAGEIDDGEVDPFEEEQMAIDRRIPVLLHRTTAAAQQQEEVSIVKKVSSIRSRAKIATAEQLDEDIE